MIVTHKNTGTLGDFIALLPLVSSLKKREKYIHLSLPKRYSVFSGLKNFLLYQNFIDEVDFLDTKGDLDIQAHRCDEPRPCRARCEALRLGLSIDENLILNYKDVDIPFDKLSMPIVIDKNTPNNDRPIMRRCGKFPDDRYKYIKFDKNFDINYNVNLCVKNTNPIYSCLTGFGVLLQFFKSIDLNIVWFNREDQKSLGVPFYEETKPFYDTYFDKPNICLKYWKDIKND
tara:strand:- start:1989 stop:2678 length:690 start_codon:yes stop_codon:yes gene_type:complete